MTSDTTTDDYVQLFNRRVPVPALTLLLRLENEGYDIRVDAQTKELCIKPTVPAHERPALTTLKPYLVILVEGTMQLLERERRTERGDDYELV
mgnify:FL=1|tara:strand:+ start:53 stop:331 length:279 start_codon:yes stop_codon:yes gene_type:complete